MKILQVHNRYFSGVGGEDTVMCLEAELLRSRGNEVRQLIVSTTELKGANTLTLVRSGVSSVWSRKWYESVARAVKEFQPDVVHVHNTFPLLSPSVYYAARHNGACVVQTLHNYRIVCTNALLFRDGRPCEDCVGHAKWRGLLRRCYNKSAGISGASFAIQTSHRIMGTYRHEVDAYIALSAFQRDILIRDGMPAEKIYIKPNFTPVAFLPDIPNERKNQIAFVGEMCTEKGVDLVLSAWAKTRPRGYRLLLFGRGPALEDLRQQYAGDDSLVWMGFQPREVVLKELAVSKYIVVGSRWYEGFIMVLIEAFSARTPAIAPDHAAFPETMQQGSCGFLYKASDVESLAHAFSLAMSVKESKWRHQSDAALKRSHDYGSDVNYIRLMEIYEAAQMRYSETRK